MRRWRRWRGIEVRLRSGGEAGGAEAAGSWVVGDGECVGELGAPAVGAGVAGEQSAALGAGELHGLIIVRWTDVCRFLQDDAGGE